MARGLLLLLLLQELKTFRIRTDADVLCDQSFPVLHGLGVRATGHAVLLETGFPEPTVLLGHLLLEFLAALQEIPESVCFPTDPFRELCSPLCLDPAQFPEREHCSPSLVHLIQLGTVRVLPTAGVRLIQETSALPELPRIQSLGTFQLPEMEMEGFRSLETVSDLLGDDVEATEICEHRRWSFFFFLLSPCLCLFFSFSFFIFFFLLTTLPSLCRSCS